MSICDYQYWISSAFNKKFYASYGSVIRAVRLKKVFFYFGHHDYMCTYDVAGLGTVEEVVNQWGSIDHLRVYESIESFKEGMYFCKGADVRNYPGIRITAKDILEKAYEGIAEVKGSGERLNVCRYRWNGTEAEEVELTDSNVWLEEDGFHTDARISEGTYATKKECEESNKISVIEFDD